MNLPSIIHSTPCLQRNLRLRHQDWSPSKSAITCTFANPSQLDERTLNAVLPQVNVFGTEDSVVRVCSGPAFYTLHPM